MREPQLPIGTYGQFATRQLSSGAWEVSCRVCDLDGVTRQVTRTRKDEGTARSELLLALSFRHLQPA